ncbi:hypothetical protein Agub_g5345, partial [Astrephomene gubernaculifera]
MAELEEELEIQLASQREALLSIEEAIKSLESDAGGVEGTAELLQMRDDLRAAVAELENALLEIKRARILQQLSASAPSIDVNSSAAGKLAPPAASGVAAIAAPAVALPSANCGGGDAHGSVPQYPPAGSLCRFRYMDGRWYAGLVQGPGRQAGTLSVRFQVPTRPFMLDPVEVMEGLVVRQQHITPPLYDNPVTTSPRSGLEAQPHQPHYNQQHHQQHRGALAEAEALVGRRALAQLPGCRLYVPVEVLG